MFLLKYMGYSGFTTCETSQLEILKISFPPHIWEKRMCVLNTVQGILPTIKQLNPLQIQLMYLPKLGRSTFFLIFNWLWLVM